MTEKWLPDIFEMIPDSIENIELDKPLNDYFMNNGIESKLILKNLGSTLVYLAIYIVFWFIYLVIKLFARFSLR
jgi:hypothetical protein